MTLPTIEQLYDVIEKTWPAADRRTVGPWVIREGKGGGKRVSAATAQHQYSDGDLQLAERTMQQLRQPPLFMIRNGDTDLDQALAKRGYRIQDPVTLYACQIETLTSVSADPVSAFQIWPPLQIAKDIWQVGGIDSGRLAVMGRSCSPKTAILGRRAERAAGAAFVAVHNKIAMIHAIEVLPELRRKGAAINMMRSAAAWAQENGAEIFSLVVTDANTGANTLYKSVGMSVVGQYHYRIKNEE